MASTLKRLPDSPASGNGPKRLPAIIYLALAHHSEQRRARTIGFGVFNWEQRFCTRCTAQWVACGLTVFLPLVYPVEVPLAAWSVALFLLPSPALLDWITQTWGKRESNTAIRIATGTLLGVGIGMEMAAAIGLDYVRILIGFGVLCVYVAAIYLLLSLRPAHPGYLSDMVDEVKRALEKQPRD